MARFLFFILVLSSSISFSVAGDTIGYSDDFSSDTTAEYITSSSEIGGSPVGTLNYDSAGQRLYVLTGDNYGMLLSHGLDASTDGSFSFTFLPTVKYPYGGQIRIRLKENDTTYYELFNTDGYGPGYLAKVVNGTEVERVTLASDYLQNNNYTITITFSPSFTSITGFGSTVSLNSDTTAIAVQSFSIDSFQQTAYYDDFIYTTSSTPPSNVSPTADAGTDTSIEVNQPVTITGSGTDTDGTIVSYEWKKADGTVLADTASFIYTPDTVGTDTLILTVTDNEGATGTDSISVTVTNVPTDTELLLFDETRQFSESDNGFHVLINSGDPLPSNNWLNPHDFYNGEFRIRYIIESPENQQAGKLQTCIWTMGNADGDGRDMFPESCAGQVTHNGVGTYYDTQIVPSNWWKMDGVPLDFTYPERFMLRTVLRGSNGCAVTTYPVDGACWDQWPNYANMNFRVTIVMVAKGTTFSGWENYPALSNVSPTADAGTDTNVEVNQPVTITGNGTDTDGTIASYAWTNADGTVLADTASFIYTPDTVGTDILTLTVTDNEGATGTDSISVTVTAGPVPNTPPVSDAGIDQSVNSGSNVTLDGSGSSDPENDTLNYQWSFVSKPAGSTALLSDPTVSDPSFIADVDGAYEVQLVVNDGDLSSNTDSVIITATTPLENTASFSDDFSTDSSIEYSVTTYTGDGGLSYDSSNERLSVTVGDNNDVRFSHTLSDSQEGTFSVDFLSVTNYPSGGSVTLRLSQDDQNYYEIYNTDNPTQYGPIYVRKVVNGTVVDSVNFQNGYVQGSQYTLQITFSPEETTINAFGESLVLNSNSSAIIVNEFSMKLAQQDGYIDNIVYTIGEENSIILTLISPQTGHIQSDNTIIVKANATLIYEGWGVKFILDEGQLTEERIQTDKIAPYEVIFDAVNPGEHTIDVYIVDDTDTEQNTGGNHDKVYNIGTGGEIIVAVGDSITMGFNDDDNTDDVSSDGRNIGGGFEPILNDLLTLEKGYPHSVLNEGMWGETSEQGLNRLSTIISSHPEASKYLIMFGTNDANPDIHVPVETFKNNMQQMIDIVKNAGKEPILAKIPRVLGDSNLSLSYEERGIDPEDGETNIDIKAYNIVIDELVSDNDIIVIPPDFYTYFKETYGDTYSTTEQDGYADTIHPDGLGYHDIAEIWLNTF